jgi:hypothetical protein
MITNAFCRETWRKETERKRTELGLDNVIVNKQETVTQEVVGENPKKPEDTNRMVGEKPKQPEDINNSKASDKEKKTEHEKQAEKQAKIAEKKDDRDIERGRRDKQQTEGEAKAVEKTAEKEPERDKQSAGSSKAAKANNERVMQEIAAIESRLGKRRLKEIAEGRGKKKRSEKRAEEAAAAAGGDVNRRSKNDGGGDMEEGEYPDSDEEHATRPSGPSPAKRKEGGGGGGGTEVEDSETKKQREREEKKQRWKRRGLAEGPSAGKNDTGKYGVHVYSTSSFSPKKDQGQIKMNACRAGRGGGGRNLLGFGVVFCCYVC